MTKYLNTKPGSVEEVVANMNKALRQDGAYQDMFKKELDKAGKGIGSMSPKEKKDFFNKIDSKYKAKNEVKEADQHGDEINQKKIDKVKADKKLADSGSKATKVETEPKVDYKN